ncbi:MAG: hypothetical protein HFJ08_17575 [Lachnospiraceae bacterium]|nr:hypothetical protein [Lachnospiraceae bacterium]
MQLWINRIHGLHFRFYSGRGCVWAVSRKQNETVAWQEREREYLTELCREHGIEIKVLGVQRGSWFYRHRNSQSRLRKRK